LKERNRTELQTIIRQYAQLRLDLSSRRLNPGDLEAALAKFGRMHDQMTAIVEQAVSEGAPIGVPLTNALNSVTSNQTSRLAAYRDRLPSSIVFLLYTCAIVTALLIGREHGRRGYGLLHPPGEHCGLRYAGFEPPRERPDPGKPGTDWGLLSQKPKD